MHNIGCAIFGCNEISKVICSLLREKGFSVQAIWGKTKEEAQEFANELKITFYSNKIDDILLRKDVSFSFVLCQPYLHSHIVVKSLGIGKHVFCDHTFGINVADAQKMASLEEQKIIYLILTTFFYLQVHASEYYPSLINLVNHSLRFLPAVVQCRKAISEKLIGDISLIDVTVKISSLIHGKRLQLLLLHYRLISVILDKFTWLCDAHQGSGCLNLIGSHVIDLCYYLTGRKAKRVHGIVKTFRQQTSTINGIRHITAPDFCNFQLELDGSPNETILVIANIQSNQGCRNGFEQDVSVIGEFGKLIIVGGDLICVRRKSGDETADYKEEKLYVEIQDMRTESTIPRQHIKGMSKMISALKEAFTTPASNSNWNKEPVASAANFNDGLYVQQVIEAIKRSSDTRSWVKVESVSLKD